MNKLTLSFSKNFNLNFFLQNKKFLYSLPLLILGASYILKKTILKKKLVIKDKFFVITGASSGIGLQITTELVKNGCKVILIARNKDRLEQIIGDFKKEGYSECYYVSADLSKEEDIEQCKKSINQILTYSNQRTTLNQHVEFLINCAGAGSWKYLEETSFKECQDMMALPYYAAFNCTRILLEPMLNTGKGTIININSPVSIQPWQGCIGYACSRWALRGFTECLRRDLEGTGVNVTEIIPGETQSEYFINNGIDGDSFPLISRFITKISPVEVGKVIVDAIINQKERVVYPFTLNVAKYLQIFPFSMLINYTLSSTKNQKRLEKIKSTQLFKNQEILNEKQ